MNKIPREKVLRLIGTIRNFIEKEAVFSNYADEGTLENSFEQNQLDVDFQGVSNGFLAEIFYAFTGHKVEVIGEVEELFTCPCCGLKTLTERYDKVAGTGYDICPYCSWEDDGTRDVTVYKSINKGSIEEYRNKICNNPNRYYIDKWFKSEKT